MSVSFECFELLSRDVRDGPIPEPEESYLIYVCLIECGQEF
jgi:hypothetical protein